MTRIPNHPKLARRVLALAVLAMIATPAAMAQRVMHDLRGPANSHIPSAEQLATIESLSVAQQAELRRLLIERRDAHAAARERSHTTLQAQRRKDRAEHERIDADSNARLRALLGDEGYRDYAEWRIRHAWGDRDRRFHKILDHDRMLRRMRPDVDGDLPPPGEAADPVSDAGT